MIRTRMGSACAWVLVVTIGCAPARAQLLDLDPAGPSPEVLDPVTEPLVELLELQAQTLRSRGDEASIGSAHARTLAARLLRAGDGPDGNARWLLGRTVLDRLPAIDRALQRDAALGIGLKRTTLNPMPDRLSDIDRELRRVFVPFVQDSTPGDAALWWGRAFGPERVIDRLRALASRDEQSAASLDAALQAGEPDARAVTRAADLLEALLHEPPEEREVLRPLRPYHRFLVRQRTRELAAARRELERVLESLDRSPALDSLAALAGLRTLHADLDRCSDASRIMRVPSPPERPSREADDRWKRYARDFLALSQPLMREPDSSARLEVLRARLRDVVELDPGAVFAPSGLDERLAGEFARRHDAWLESYETSRTAEQRSELRASLRLAMRAARAVSLLSTLRTSSARERLNLHPAVQIGPLGWDTLTRGTAHEIATVRRLVLSGRNEDLLRRLDALERVHSPALALSHALRDVRAPAGAHPLVTLVCGPAPVSMARERLVFAELCRTGESIAHTQDAEERDELLARARKLGAELVAAAERSQDGRIHGNDATHEPE